MSLMLVIVTMFQLIDSFKRLNQIDNYFISIDSLMAGADSKDVTVKHWGDKIQ